MKKIFSILLAAAAALCAVACTENTPEEASLSVNPTRIEFTAENAAATNVTVTATGTGWSVSVTETGSGWLTAEKIDDKTVTVTAANNTTADQRIGGVIITPDNEDVSKKEITVVQAGAENPVVYDLQLSPSLLEFEPESAEAQTVTVTVSGEMGWKAEAAEGCADWVTVTAAADSFTVKVGDNPDTKERIGSVVVTPDNESVEPKEVTIKQKPKVLPPSLSVDVTELNFKFKDVSVGNIMVTAVNCNWDVTVKDEAGAKPEWIHVTNLMPDISTINVTVDANTELVERVAYIDIVADVESVETIRVTVTQDAAVEHYSDLTEDIDISPMLKNSKITCYPLNDWESEDASTAFDIRFWSDGVTHDSGKWPPYSGSGEFMNILLSADKIVFNDENKYDLSEGEYIVTFYDGYTNNKSAFTISAGRVAEWDSSVRQESWYYVIEDAEVVTKAPISSGKLIVERNGEDYILTVEFEDDLGFKITGKYEGPLEIGYQGQPSSPMPTSLE